MGLNFIESHVLSQRSFEPSTGLVGDGGIINGTGL
jgi:hypothetical protein